MGPEFWKPDKTSKLKKCSERKTDSCDPTETDGCCGVIPCTYCLTWEPYQSATEYGTATFATSSWTGTISTATFVAFWEVGYSSGVCEFVVELDGVEIFREPCYGSITCRDSSGSAEATIGYDSGTLTWTKREPRPLEYVTDPDTGCKTWFCGDCECTCDCLCVTVTDSYAVVTTGEICDTSYPCDAPLWEGTVADLAISLLLGRDIYGECIITPTVDGIELDSVSAGGCGNLAASFELADGTSIVVACKVCDCADAGHPECCDRTDLPDDLTLTVTLAGTLCQCGDWLGITVTLSRSMFTQTPGLSRWGGMVCGPCTTINGVDITQIRAFRLECTEGVIGNVDGVPTDLELFLYDRDNCTDTSMDGDGSPTTTSAVATLATSSCQPLILTFDFPDDVALVPWCQDPMTSPGPPTWQFVVTE